jgi:hypothetical protein
MQNEYQEIISVKKFLIASLLENQKLLNITNEDLYDSAEIISDRALVYRFILKYKHDLELASFSLIDHLDWRIENRIASLSLSSMELKSKLMDDGIFSISKQDKFSRPVAFIKPGLFIPNSTKSVEEMKNSLIFLLEILRRFIYKIDRDCPVEMITQALLVVDLNNFGMGNMVEYF